MIKRLDREESCFCPLAFPSFYSLQNDDSILLSLLLQFVVLSFLQTCVVAGDRNQWNTKCHLKR